ncbi:MAG: lysophospholipid acyltransferase family protein [Clostridiaceae bacterium]
MKTIIKYIRFIFYMIGTMFKRIKYEKTAKKFGKKKAEEYLDKILLDWVKFCIRLLEIKVITIGAENIPEGNFLIVANHQGNLDIPCIMYSLNRKVGFIAKKEMENIPLISYWMKKINCVFMDRENIREAVKSINKGVDLLKAGKVLAIFPEGTRSRGNKMGEFKKGSLKLGTKAKVPILPIAINGSYKIMEESHGWIIKKGDIKIKISKPIITENLSMEEVKELPSKIEGIIRENLNEL